MVMERRSGISAGDPPERKQKGRAAGFNTPIRFQRLHLEPMEIYLQYEGDPPPLRTTFFHDSSRSILAKNDSPDIPFTYSINPYRGCEHGCIYCYARPSHEYLGFSAGLDFETKIMVKLNAPRLLEETLCKKSWQPQEVAFSGNTDCYQPVERKLEITRKCLQVFLKYRNPIGIVTKNALVLRDIDILREMAKLNLVHVMISVTSLDPALIRKMEPRTPAPAVRLQTIEELARNEIPVGVNAAPIIPGLTDEELPAILNAAAKRGATTAGYILARLPGPVESLFFEWVNREFPDRASKIISRIRDTRQGQLSDARFGTRMTGEGHIAKAINDLFNLHAQKYNLTKRWCGLSTDRFVSHRDPQMELFHGASP
jgi:DNA repair photolyase